MADKVREVDYYYVKVADKPGAGAKVMSNLRKERVNLLAFTGFPVSKTRAQLDFVPKDSRVFRRAARRLGLRVSGRKKAFLVQGTDRAGAAAAVVERLAEKDIGVTAAQALCGGSGRWGMLLWVKPRDLPRARRALKG
jgi:hypothetical protein